MNACASVGSVWPTFNVPGMLASSTTRPNLNSDVVVANEPIPSVSKKSVTTPMTICTGFGHPPPVARACTIQKATNATPTIASAMKTPALASTAPS